MSIRSCLAVCIVVTGLLARPAGAQIGSDRYASIVIDAGSGAVLSQSNADEYRFPASLTKMMTLYLLFESLRDHRLVLNQQVPVSSWAASMSPTKLGLVPGTYITVEQALLGLVTKSANDAAAALGELMGGDEDRFAQMMTLRARALGMTATTFRNASGLPDWAQVTTARDMATLARHIIQDFPAYYRYFSVPSFSFHGRQIFNHQRMLQTYPGADGLKTGYIEASGFNVVTSAVRGEVRLIGVVLGANTGGERDQHMATLLDEGFDRSGAPVTRQPWNRMAALIAAAQAAQSQPASPAYPMYQPTPYAPSYAPFAAASRSYARAEPTRLYRPRVVSAAKAERYVERAMPGARRASHVLSRPVPLPPPLPSQGPRVARPTHTANAPYSLLRTRG